MEFKNVRDVVRWRLCVGCGACVYACPERNISLVDCEYDGIRPLIRDATCKSCGECLKVCPGYGIAHGYGGARMPDSSDPEVGWGPVLEVWEGYAVDPDLRHSGSSGGAVSALALYCLEELGMDAVVHTGADRNTPWKNATTISHSRSDLLAATGSRYSPASPCDGLAHIEVSDKQSVFLGKPCDVEGLRKAESLRPELAKRVGAVIGIFCAGTPSTLATLELLKTLQVEPNRVRGIRYRGKGWPGMFAVTQNGDESPSRKMPYRDAWGFLQKYRPFRCYLCPDGTSEFADISSGDAWHRLRTQDEFGYSLIIARTEKGREIISGAIGKSYVSLQQVEPDILERAQGNLLAKRREIWGRLFAMRILGVPVPTFDGFHLLKNWLESPIAEQARSILGTMRRVLQRGYRKPLEC